jgi:hypothetical protein
MLLALFLCIFSLHLPDEPEDDDAVLAPHRMRWRMRAGPPVLFGVHLVLSACRVATPLGPNSINIVSHVLLFTIGSGVRSSHLCSADEPEDDDAVLPPSPYEMEDEGWTGTDNPDYEPFDGEQSPWLWPMSRCSKPTCSGSQSPS